MTFIFSSTEYNPHESNFNVFFFLQIYIGTVGINFTIKMYLLLKLSNLTESQKI